MRCSSRLSRGSGSRSTPEASVCEVANRQQLPSSVWTIGHSTLPLDEFIEILQAHGIRVLADVRRFPGSRAYPHFNAGNLAGTLPGRGIAYLALTELGGRRPPNKGSKNTAWRNASFRGYADFMETEAFAEGIARLLAATAAGPTAVMRAESVWWRCHRGLISDHLKCIGVPVQHIVNATKSEPHPYTSAARIVGGQLTYSVEDTQPLL